MKLITDKRDIEILNKLYEKLNKIDNQQEFTKLRKLINKNVKQLKLLNYDRNRTTNFENSL